MTKKEEKGPEIQIMEVESGIADFCIIGTSPMLHNCMSMHTMQALLLPPPKKSKKELELSIKHFPLEEYQGSVYYSRDPNNPTYVQHLASAFGGAMRTAALDLSGVTKAEIGRLTWVLNDRVNIYGVPQMDMRGVRMADQKRTPDIRSRAIIPEWACRISVKYTKPQLRSQSVANLVAAAGVFIGVGDGRNEKGCLSYGLFQICNENDADFQRIIATGGRDAQVAAMEEPDFYTEETERLYLWWKEAVKDHRAFKPVKSQTKKGKKDNGARTQAEA